MLCRHNTNNWMYFTRAQIFKRQTHHTYDRQGEMLFADSFISHRHIHLQNVRKSSCILSCFIKSFISFTPTHLTPFHYFSVLAVAQVALTSFKSSRVFRSYKYVQFFTSQRKTWELVWGRWLRENNLATIKNLRRDTNTGRVCCTDRLDRPQKHDGS